MDSIATAKHPPWSHQLIHEKKDAREGAMHTTRNCIGYLTMTDRILTNGWKAWFPCPSSKRFPNRQVGGAVPPPPIHGAGWGKSRLQVPAFRASRCRPLSSFLIGQAPIPPIGGFLQFGVPLDGGAGAGRRNRGARAFEGRLGGVAMETRPRCWLRRLPRERWES